MQTKIYTETPVGTYTLDFRVGLHLDGDKLESVAIFSQSSKGCHNFNIPQNFTDGTDTNVLSREKVEKLRVKHQKTMDAKVKAFHAEMEEISRCFMRDVEVESGLEELK